MEKRQSTDGDRLLLHLRKKYCKIAHSPSPVKVSKRILSYDTYPMTVLNSHGSELRLIIFLLDSNRQVFETTIRFWPCLGQSCLGWRHSAHSRKVIRDFSFFSIRILFQHGRLRKINSSRITTNNNKNRSKNKRQWIKVM